MSEQERFLARLQTERDGGLVDVKFFFHPSRMVEPEEIFAALNEIDAAIANGNCVKHTDWNGNQPA